jgi:phenylalanyl-tRNA synthetase beta chain
LINKEVPVDRLSATIQKAGGDYLMDVTLFDVYHHEKLGDKKSIALSLVWQDKTKTLMDSDVNTAMDRVLSSLYEEHNAILRE